MPDESPDKISPPDDWSLSPAPVTAASKAADPPEVVLPPSGDEPADRGAVVRAASKLAGSTSAPWLLQQFFNDQIDLSTELASRFPNMPLMSIIRLREMDSKTRRGVATLSNADGMAGVVVDADAAGSVQLSFTFGSMLALRFRMDGLSGMDRARWLELMRREQGGVAFLWGQSRWEQDYAICVTRRRFANLYAFSHNGFEASVRLTPEVAKKLIDWLDKFWQAEPPAGDPPKMLTW